MRCFTDNYFLFFLTSIDAQCSRTLKVRRIAPHLPHKQVYAPRWWLRLQTREKVNVMSVAAQNERDIRAEPSGQTSLLFTLTQFMWPCGHPSRFPAHENQEQLILERGYAVYFRRIHSIMESLDKADVGRRPWALPVMMIMPKVSVQSENNV